jgi:hypothetical protein
MGEKSPNLVTLTMGVDVMNAICGIQKIMSQLMLWCAIGMRFSSVFGAFLTRFGAFWRVLARFGAFWRVLARFGAL